jgi:hypothetical protein
VSDTAFVAWLTRMGGAHLAADDVAAAWLHEFFGEYGPVDPDVFHDAYNLRRLELVESAVPMVVTDIKSTTGLNPEVRVFTTAANGHDAIAVSYEGSYQTGLASSLNAEVVLSTIADYLQSYVLEELRRAWPVCPHHAYGLHAEVHRDEAVWACLRHDHTVAHIGSLKSV